MATPRTKLLPNETRPPDSQRCACAVLPGKMLRQDKNLMHDSLTQKTMKEKFKLFPFPFYKLQCNPKNVYSLAVILVRTLCLLSHFWLSIIALAQNTEKTQQNAG